MKRQAINISLAELLILQKELIDQSVELNKLLETDEPIDYQKQWSIAIINKTPRCSDTWEIER